MNRKVLSLHAITELLKQDPCAGEFYYCKENNRITELITLCKKRGVKVNKVDIKEIDKIAGSRDHKFAAFLGERTGKRSKKFNTVHEVLDFNDRTNQLVIILDGITDPHNFGAIIRSADQFRADCVVIPESRSAGNTKVIDQTSAGANQHMPVIKVVNLAREIEQLKEAGFWFYGAAMDGSGCHDIDLKGKIGLVLGSEGKGIRENVRKKCDSLISIPCNGNIDSLNVSVAAGVLMYETRRQQKFTYI